MARALVIMKYRTWPRCLYCISLGNFIKMCCYLQRLTILWPLYEPQPAYMQQRLSLNEPRDLRWQREFSCGPVAIRQYIANAHRYVLY